MKRRLSFVGSEPPDPADVALRKLAEFIGVDCETIELSALPERSKSTSDVSTVSARALQQLLSGADAVTCQEKLNVLFRGVLLVRGFETGDVARLTAVLTDGALGNVRPIPSGKRTYSYAEALDRRQIPLAGLSQTVDETRNVSAFVTARTEPRVTTLVSVERQPMLVHIDIGRTSVFLLSDGKLVDIDQACGSKDFLMAATTALLPMTVFLRSVFGAACWTTPVPSANLVIDDPMVRRRYGFVEYHRLLAEARAHGYAVTIAFIPFNHRRSERQTAQFLQGHRDRFSLAVHGCDHTESEFGIEEETRLLYISQLGMRRMRNHESLTAMPFDPVMVFPQGVFTVQAFSALKRSGYNAVVNTEFLPRNHSGELHITVRDMLEGATMAYAGFPLFRRRYPTSIFDCAVDLLWGKPVLLVEHHGYFRHGYSQLANFVGGLNGLVPKLTWKPLGDLVMEHAHFRPCASGGFAVRFFTPVFHFKNPTNETAHFVLEKGESEPELIEGVTLNGRPLEFNVRQGALHSEIDLRAGAAAIVKVTYRETPAPPTYRLAARYRYSAAARRYMSDVRDNYIARNDRLLSVAMKIKRMLHGKR